MAGSEKNNNFLFDPEIPLIEVHLKGRSSQTGSDIHTRFVMHVLYNSGRVDMKFPSQQGCGIPSVSRFDELICINSVFLRSRNKSVSHCAL